ncbi:MAG: DUF721 domain-containing protein [Opitutaceae bacterium]
MPPKEPHHFSKLAEELVGDLRGVPFEEPRRQVKRATQPLAGLIEELMIKHQIGRPSAEQTIRDHWVALVGAPNAAYSHALQVEKAKLTIMVSHAVVKTELFHHRGEIVDRIRQLPGCEGIRSLNLRSG